MVAQIGFSMGFSGHLCVSSSHIRNLKISKTFFLTLRSIFQNKAHKLLKNCLNPNLVRRSILENRFETTLR